MPDDNNTLEQEFDLEGLNMTEEELGEYVDHVIEKREHEENERIFAEIERKRREAEDKYISELNPENKRAKLSLNQHNNADMIQYTEKEFYHALSKSPELSNAINDLKEVDTYPDGASLSEEDRAQMAKIIGHLETFRDDWKNYTSSYLNLKSNEDRYAEENRCAAIFKKSLDLIEQEMTEFSLSEASDASAFTAIHSYVSSLKAHYDEMMNGSLEVPKDATEIVFNNPKEDADTKNSKLVWVDRKDEPLFTHEPSAADVFQGGTGDCFFLAAVSSVVSHNPETIRNMFRDNHDGTVTVRLYRENNSDNDFNDPTPYYITVDKTTAVNKEDGKTVYAQNALWVQILEKAYAASGFHKSGSYNGIDGGFEHNAIQALLGFQNVHEIDISKLTEDQKFDYIKMALKDGHYVHAGTKTTRTGTFPQKYKNLLKEYKEDFIKKNKDNFIKEYKNEAKKKLNEELKKYIDEHEHFITTKASNGLFVKREKGADVLGNHAYAVIGAEEVEGEKYIFVKEPNGLFDVDVNGNISKNSEVELEDFKGGQRAHGYLAIPLYDFHKMFPEVKDSMPIDSRLYDNPTTEIRGLANQIFEGLNESRSFMARKSMRYASDDFRAFYKASEELMNLTKNEFPSKTAVENALKQLSETARTYYDKRNTGEKVDADRNLRMNMAKTAMKLKSIYEIRKTPECEGKIREAQEEMLANRIAYIENRGRKKADTLVTADTIKAKDSFKNSVTKMTAKELFDLAAKENPKNLRKVLAEIDKKTHKEPKVQKEQKTAGSKVKK